MNEGVKGTSLANLLIDPFEINKEVRNDYIDKPKEEL
jgi:hypothetical protein